MGRRGPTSAIPTLAFFARGAWNALRSMVRRAGGRNVPQHVAAGEHVTPSTPDEILPIDPYLSSIFRSVEPDVIVVVASRHETAADSVVGDGASGRVARCAGMDPTHSPAPPAAANEPNPMQYTVTTSGATTTSSGGGMTVHVTVNE